ncbi:MAG: type II toxin-antitoxin system PemK/MazF family toxin [Bacteroidales bacterium]|nr:type II toxin-antitoxin system PemK/MazF family toxin [Bacteroidales bacterium]
MKKLSFGEIVLLRFPFTDGQKHKKRPALILLDTVDGDIIVCRITSKIYNTEFDFEIENWKVCGLRLPSVIRLHKIASLEKNIVEQTMGTINEKMKQKLKDKFANLLR